MADGRSRFDIDIATRADTSGAEKAAAAIHQVGQEAHNLEGVAVGSGIGNFLGGLAEGAVAEAKQQVQQLAREAFALADQLDDLAGKAGVSAKSLQTIGNAASLGTGSLEGVAQAFVFLQKSAAGANSSDELAGAFRRLGVSSEELKRLKPDEILYQIADAVNAASDRSQALRDVLTVAGRDASNLFPTLEQGSQAIRKVGESMGVMSDAARTRLAAMNDDIAKTKTQMVNAMAEMLGTTKALMSDANGLTALEALLARNPTRLIAAVKDLREQMILMSDAAGVGGKAGAEVEQAALNGLAAAGLAAANATKAAVAGGLDAAVKAAEEGKKLDESMGKLGEKFREQQKKDGAALDENMGKLADKYREGQQANAELVAKKKEEQAILAAQLAGQEDLAAKLRIEKTARDEIAQLQREGRLTTEVQNEINKTAELQKQVALLLQQKNERKAMEALQDVKANFEGVDQRGSKGAQARAAAQANFERELARKAQDAIDSGIDPDAVAVMQRQKRDEYANQLRQARGRFGGPTRSSDRNANGPSGPSEDFQKAFGNRAPAPAAPQGDQAAQQLAQAGASTEATAANLAAATNGLAGLSPALQQLLDVVQALSETTRDLKAGAAAARRGMGN